MRFDLLMEALPIMGTGYLGIFVVTGVIIALVTLQTKFTSRRQTEIHDQRCRRCPAASFYLQVLNEPTEEFCLPISLLLLNWNVSHIYDINKAEELKKEVSIYGSFKRNITPSGTEGKRIPG